MAINAFNNMDLNLLRTLLVLSQELNTRKAAERLFVSQPAISQALQKLRHHLGDELFVKIPSGLKPTPFTVEFISEITPFMNGISNSLNKTRNFDPLTLSTTLKIAVAPVVLTCLSGALISHFAKVAPNCIIELTAWKADTPENIQNEEISIAVVSNYHKAFQGLQTEILTTYEGKLVVRKEHPIKAETVSAKDLEPYPIASVITPGYNDNFTQAAVIMESEGYYPIVGFRSEFVSAVIDVIEHTDYFMPHSSLFPIHKHPELRFITPTIDGKPYTDYIYVYYHVAQNNTQLMAWLIAQIKQIVVESMDRT
jgi:DNA-binding transcriptional LysR family regulator